MSLHQEFKLDCPNCNSDLKVRTVDSEVDTVSFIVDDVQITEEPPMTRAEVQAAIQVELARRYRIEEQIAHQKADLDDWWDRYENAVKTKISSNQVLARSVIEKSVGEIARLKSQLV